MIILNIIYNKTLKNDYNLKNYYNTEYYYV